jgi:hypothetical protein
MKYCNLDKSKKCKLHYTKNKTCCNNRKIGQSWCWNKNKKNACSVIKNKMKCRLVKGKNETCCINPMKGHWCWSKNISRKNQKKIKSQCCK